ncbi:melatonin receptor type 1A-like [Lytechinus variegatus]|uniref:melatonin receptor type 1A-like n=1 Tax=Lytechinus variegatus TaxID=7654 RepID=UPI001BB2AF14|nr:melatonin receptor type 1A-like [Lytechinus variegatus]
MESTVSTTILSHTMNLTSMPTSGDSFKFDDRAQRLVVAITFIIVSILGTIGNTLVIMAVAISRKLRTITNVFVVNLAVADLLTSLSIPWNAVALISQNGWPLHPYICTLAGGITYLCIVASLYSLASIAINRFILVTKKHRVYQKIFTKLNLVIWIILIWVMSFILVIFLPIVDVGGLGYNEKYSICGQSSSHPKDDIYQLVQAIGSFPIPLIIICYSYIKIFLHVRSHMKVMSTHMPESHQTDSTVVESISHTTSNEGHTVKPQNNHQPPISAEHQGKSKMSSQLRDISENGGSKTINANGNKKSDGNTNTNNSKVNITARDSSTELRLRQGRSLNRRQLQITKNMFVVVCAFFLCIAPFTICLFFDDSDPFVPYASAIVLCNACINPIIYATKHPVFNTVMKFMVTCRLRDVPEPSRMLHRLTIR